MNEGANRREKCRESVWRGRGALGGVTSDCAVVDPKRKYSVLVFDSGSRSGTDASTEMLRLWTVDKVPPLDVELLVCLGWCLEARRRAVRTRRRTTVMMMRKPPMVATMMIARLLLFGDCDGVGDPVVC